MALMDRIQHVDTFLQILYFFLNLPVSTKLLTDLLNGTLLTSGEHVIPDKLSCTVSHPKGNGTLLHSHKTSRIHASQDHVIKSCYISLSGRIDPIQFHSSSVVRRLFSRLAELADLCFGIRHAIRIQISVLRDGTRMAEKCIFSIDIHIRSADLKYRAKTGGGMKSGILYFQNQCGIKILIRTVGCTILLCTTQIAHDTSSVLRIIRCLIQKRCRHTTIEDYLHSVHYR